VIINRWPKYVSNELITLLEKWIEKRIVSVVKSPYLPSNGRRYLFVKRYNKNGLAIFDEVILEGIEHGARGTRPREMTSVDVFGYDVFLSLSALKRGVVLAYADPFSEFANEDSWQSFLRHLSLKNHTFEESLKGAMIEMQRKAEEKGIVKCMTLEGEIWGLENIAEFLCISRPTLIKYIKDHSLKIPVSKVGNRWFSTEKLLADWKLNLLNHRQFWMTSCDSSGNNEGRQ